MFLREEKSDVTHGGDISHGGPAPTTDDRYVAKAKEYVNHHVATS